MKAEGKRMKQDKEKMLKRCSSLKLKRKKSNDAMFYTEKGKGNEQKQKKPIIPIKKGDIINIRKLLFTKHRDYLIKSNYNQVKAEQLEGKVIVIVFESLHRESEFIHLIDIYNEIHLKCPFEVVFVAPTHGNKWDTDWTLYDEPPKCFGDFFSHMPWTAIPYSDVKSRERLERSFGINPAHTCPNCPVIDPTGLVLQCYASFESLFSKYGAPGYPFSDERLQFLNSQDDALLRQPSITKLLASPERNYVISNDGGQVPLLNLENKVVAIYFFEHATKLSIDHLTLKLMRAYQQLVKNDNFEVVLIYIYNSYTINTNDDSFWEIFKTMPWLALPYKDPVCKRLLRICAYPLDREDGLEPDPRLVIIGPRGEFFEPFGADILLKFGIQAYPFTRTSMVELVAEKAKKVKPEILWDSNTVFRRKDGSMVRFSQVAGKRIILLLGNQYTDQLPILKSKYNQMKDTDDEFEVIHIFFYYDPAADVPWLVHPPVDFNSLQYKLLYASNFCARVFFFDRHGQVVRISSHPPYFEDTKFPKFPFYAGDLENEVLSELYQTFRWEYYDRIWLNM